MSPFLGAAAGSPYIVFISTSGMLRSSDRYIYIYIYIYIDIYIYRYIYIYNMHSHASTTTHNLYANLYYAKTKWLLFETKDIFQKCNSTIKTLLGLKTAAKDIWSILGRTKSSF